MGLFDTEPVAVIEPQQEKKQPKQTKQASQNADSLDVFATAETIVFDIETGGLPLDHLKSILPAFSLESIKHPGEFDPASVKLGNLKDKQKIAEKIQDAATKHSQALANHELELVEGEGKYWAQVEEMAALSPITGEVLAIGMGAVSKDGSVAVQVMVGSNELELLNAFWKFVSETKAKFTGWNIHGFDVPFLVNRSRHYGFQPPVPILDRSGKWPDFRWVELMNYWACGGRSSFDPFQGRDKSGIRAKDLARFVGVHRPDDATPVTGETFARFFRGTAEERQQAITYLDWDIREEIAIAEFLGVM